MAPRKQTTKCSCGKEGCDADEKVQKTAKVLGIPNSLNAAAIILGTLKSVADISGTPGLKGACGTMLGLINLVQDMKDVQSGFRDLLHSICMFLVIVIRYDKEQQVKGQKLNTHLRRAMTEFNKELKKIKTYVEEQVERGWLKRLVKSPMDKGKVNELRQRFEHTYARFNTELTMDTNHQVHRMAEEIKTRFEAVSETTSGVQDLHASGVSSIEMNGGPAPVQQQAYQQQSNSSYSQQPYAYDQGYQQYPQSPSYDGGQYQQQGYGHQSYLPTQGYGGPQGGYWPPQPPSYRYPSHQSPAGPNINNVGSVGNANFGNNYGTINQG